MRDSLDDPFDVDELAQPDTLFISWRRVQHAPQTVQEAEQLAADAWRMAWRMSVGVEHRAHEVGQCAYYP